jgi:hypothetical protein
MTQLLLICIVWIYRKANQTSLSLFSLSEPFFFRIERAHLKWDQKNSLIETRSSGVRGVALGNEWSYFDSRIRDRGLTHAAPADL